MAGLFITIGLLMQAAALFLLIRRLRGRWFVHAGAIFIVSASAFHGLNEILLWVFPNRDRYRPLVSLDYVAQFTVWISLAILLFTAAYLLVLRRGRASVQDGDEITWQSARIRRVFNWPLLLIATVPLFVLTLSGVGYFSGVTLNTQPLGTSAGLTYQFFLLATPLAGFALIARFGRRLFLPVLVVQSAALALVDSRYSVLIAAAVLLYALSRAGISIRARQLWLAGASFLLIALVITSGRAAQGRFDNTAGASLRLDFLTTGLANLMAPTTWEAISADLGYRFDGNSFGAMELNAIDQWRMPTLGIRPLVNDALLAIPSFLNPNKTLAPVETRSEKEYAEIYLDLPLPYVVPGAHEDILPTQLGALIGMFGTWGLLLAATVLGAAFALADRWLLRRLTPARLLLGIGLFSCAMSYQASWDVYSITFRGIVLLLPLLWILQLTVPLPIARRPSTSDYVKRSALAPAAPR
jgi:hypothetical protein